MNRPKLLDLFACEGGATVGYERAGYDVYAVDLDRARLARNPAKHKLVADALDVLLRLINGETIVFDDGATLNRWEIALVHMSPPCQFYSIGQNGGGNRDKWPALIEPCRELASALGVPYVIENVKGAESHLVDPIGLCGCMFGLSTIDTDGVRMPTAVHDATSTKPSTSARAATCPARRPLSPRSSESSTR